MRGSIIIAGKRVPIDATVRTWEETGLGFTEQRVRPSTTACVLHWTGAENPPDKLFANLRASRLSVHFAIDQVGVVWQFMDAHLRGAHCHAHGANGFAVGVEIINRGSDLNAPSQGVERVLRRETIHGRIVTYAGFTESQTQAALALTEALCRTYALPLLVPRERGDVLATAMSLSEARAFRGVVGHFQFERGKADPGLELLRRVHQRGVELMGPGVA